MICIIYQRCNCWCCSPSPLEYYDHLLAHIECREPHINALYAFDPQRVRDCLVRPGGIQADTLGRIPIDPYYTGRCAGPMTRTMDDCALMMRYLPRPDTRDATSLLPEKGEWGLGRLSVRG